MLHGMKLPVSISWALGKEPITSLFYNRLRAQHSEVRSHRMLRFQDLMAPTSAMIDIVAHYGHAMPRSLIGHVGGLQEFPSFAVPAFWWVLAEN
ncbi:uncharacterized protein N7484_008975 [Penicillium longicatenatum]|uniref:uncharacterized protein n=1 Tax=Penicillium longicatenatum TaxID=1561947 RepID=UPI0025498D37|nr:uncharacterized protein N7484_008975 [Penicillium longicatenatum]KAJ5635662.1 hypothetical protein N7484_008975 [Penicillium longicatenatum]